MSRFRLVSGLAVAACAIAQAIAAVPPTGAHPAAQTGPPYQARGARILIADSEPSIGFADHQALLMVMIEPFFDAHTWKRHEWSRAGPRSSLGLSLNEVTYGALSGADLLILPAWTGFGYGTSEGPRTTTGNLTNSELDAIERWVKDGGRLLGLASSRGAPVRNNLPELLARFGLRLNPDEASFNSEPMVASGSIQNTTFALALPGWTWPLAGGSPVVTSAHRTIGAVASAGRGRVAFVGNGSFFAQGPVLEDLAGGGFDQVENVAFFVDLLSWLTDRPRLSPPEREYLDWDTRLLALFAAAVRPGDARTYRTRNAAEGDFTGATGLLAGAASGQRCDLGPGCVPFEIDQAAKEQLRGAAELTDRTVALLNTARAALDRRDYPAVERAYEAALIAGRQAIHLIRSVRGRYDPVGRAYYENLAPPALTVVLVVVTVVLLGAFALSAVCEIRPWRRTRR